MTHREQRERDQRECDFERALVGHLAEAARFHAAYATHRNEAPSGWAPDTPYPWLASLDPAEVGEFAAELLAYILDAAKRRTLESLEGNLQAWRSTAEIHQDPELVAHLRESVDPAQIAELLPPTDTEVRAARRGSE